VTSRAITIGAYPAESCDYVCLAPVRHYRNSLFSFSFFTALFSWMTNKNLQQDHCSSVAMMMITGVIETFAICHLYRLLWPWFTRLFITRLFSTSAFRVPKIFFIFLKFLIFFRVVAIFSFSLIISYFKLACFFEVLSKPVTSCSNLSLNVEAQGVPGHSTF